MKEQAINKINKIGKISGIVALICKILLSIGLVMMLIGTIACFAVPKDAVIVGAGGSGSVDINLDVLGISLTDNELTDIEKEMEHIKKEGEETKEYELTDVSLSDERIFIDALSKQKKISIHDLGWMLLILSGAIALSIVTVCFVSPLCKAFCNCESPFEEKVVKQLNSLAYSLLPWVVLGSLTESISESIFTNNFNLMIGVDLGMVLIILFIFVLAYIFKYGAVLQQESDETL